MDSGNEEDACLCVACDHRSNSDGQALWCECQIGSKEAGAKIEILGSGCPKCEELARNVEEAVRQLGLEAEVVKVTDIIEIANRGAVLMPALAVEGEIKLAGKVVTVEEAKAFLTQWGGGAALELTEG